MDATVRDLFAKKDLGTFRESWTGVVGLHDVRMVQISPVKSSSEHKEWRPWLQHSALHALVRTGDQSSGLQAVPGQPAKLARHQASSTSGKIQVS